MIDISRLCAQLDLDPLARGLQVVEARELAAEFFPRLDTDRPALVVNLATAELARKVRRTLIVNYPSTHAVTLLQGRRPFTLRLTTLHRHPKFTRATVLHVPPLGEVGSPQTLAGIVARLRAPRGCPWDRKQTHASLRRALLEETYEVIEALDAHDPAALREELGDLLLHVLFQTQIARDEDEFSLAEVGEELAAKLIRRHPHVFGELRVSGAEEVLANWERIKQQERETKAGPAPKLTLESNIPRELPALARAQKIYSRARRKGIEVKPDGFGRTLSRLADRESRERALGERLFALAAWAEENGLDATSALRQATRRVVEQAEGTS